jgi:dTDP-glucose 4,6-dehydratase
LENKPLPVYGTGLNVRDWIYVDDHSRALKAVLEGGRSGEVYNIGGRCERTNIQVVKTILDLLGKPETLIQYVPDRPGHDLRYAIDCTKIETELGWTPQATFEQGLKDTVNWYIRNNEWVERVRSGAYKDYYRRMYDRREQWLEAAHDSGSRTSTE